MEPVRRESSVTTPRGTPRITVADEAAASRLREPAIFRERSLPGSIIEPRRITGWQEVPSTASKSDARGAISEPVN